MPNFAPLFPLFVPSFSSKGNLLLCQPDGTYISDNYSLLQELDLRVSKSYLVSAYDIYYGLMPRNPRDMPETEYLFIDSGGYETNDSFDLSERNKFNYHVMPWDKDKMKEIYSSIISCPKFQNAVTILSIHDTLGSFEQQLAEALPLGKEFPNAIINFIIKICFPFECLLDEISKARTLLQSIQIIGITEKELGYTVRDRLQNLIRMRKTLNACGWNGSIHIFGGLEPNLAKLYYLAGADIFDGLSWQRIFYRNNASIYNPESFYISLPEHENKFLMMVDNLSVLQDVSNNLSAIFDMRTVKMNLMDSYLASNNMTIGELLTVMEV